MKGYEHLFIALPLIRNSTEYMLNRKKNCCGVVVFFLAVLFFVFCLLMFFLTILLRVIFKKFISALEQQSSLYGWTDIKPGAISWEYYRTTKNKHPLIFAHFVAIQPAIVFCFWQRARRWTADSLSMLKLAQYVKDNRPCSKINALLSRLCSIPMVS